MVTLISMTRRLRFKNDSTPKGRRSWQTASGKLFGWFAPTQLSRSLGEEKLDDIHERRGDYSPAILCLLRDGSWQLDLPRRGFEDEEVCLGGAKLGLLRG